jgi:hypothetical protein
MCACAGMHFSVPTVAQTPEDSEPILEYSRDPNSIIVLFDLVGGMREEIPVLRIYGDGRVLVHRDIDKDFEMHLSDEEIKAWLRFLYDHGILKFDGSAIKREIEEIEFERNRSKLSRGEPIQSRKVFDAGLSVIEVNLTAFRPGNAAGQVVNDFSHKASWANPRQSKIEFPEIAELGRFADAVDTLLELSRYRELRDPCQSSLHVLGCILK